MRAVANGIACISLLGGARQAWAESPSLEWRTHAAEPERYESCCGTVCFVVRFALSGPHFLGTVFRTL